MIINTFNGVWSNPADRNPARITKAEKNFAKKLDFKGKISNKN